jgi:hypothetical protein
MGVGLKDSIDLLYEQGQGTLRVQFDQNDHVGSSVHISGSRYAFEFLAKAVADVLEGMDCKFSVAPFAAGGGWFGRTMEEGSGGYYTDGRVLMPNEGGIYVHCQPCKSGAEIFPGGRGLAWMCFSNELSESTRAELDYDPAYLVVEGWAEELLGFKHLLLQAANGEPQVQVDEAAIRCMFSETRNVFRLGCP